MKCRELLDATFKYETKKTSLEACITIIHLGFRLHIKVLPLEWGVFGYMEFFNIFWLLLFSFRNKSFRLEFSVKSGKHSIRTLSQVQNWVRFKKNLQKMLAQNKTKGMFILGTPCIQGVTDQIMVKGTNIIVTNVQMTCLQVL